VKVADDIGFIFGSINDKKVDYVIRREGLMQIGASIIGGFPTLAANRAKHSKQLQLRGIPGFEMTRLEFAEVTQLHRWIYALHSDYRGLLLSCVRGILLRSSQRDVQRAGVDRVSYLCDECPATDVSTDVQETYLSNLTFLAVHHRVEPDGEESEQPQNARVHTPPEVPDLAGHDT
jgi:hypothetical protein